MLCHGKIANKSLVDKEGAEGIVVGTLYISYILRTTIWFILFRIEYKMACVCSIKEEINRNIPVSTKKRNKK